MPGRSQYTASQPVQTSKKQALHLSLCTTDVGTGHSPTDTASDTRSPVASFDWTNCSAEPSLTGAVSIPSSTVPITHSNSPPCPRSSSGTSLSMIPSGSLSTKTRPGTSNSSHTQEDPLSPMVRSNPMSLQVICQPFDAEANAGAASPGSAASEGGMAISSPWGQVFHHTTALKTSCGPMQIPIDIRVASRETDEKRRRNAGASARLRQRRKTREKEQAIRLAYLEAQIRTQGEDVEFYRRERDELAQIVANTPGFQDVLPRPMSPQQYRSSWPSVEQHGVFRPSEGLDVQRRIHVGALPPPPQQPPLPMLCSWDHPDLESLLSSTFSLLS